MKLNRKLSKTHFYLSQILILIFGLIFIAVLYYILNVQATTVQKPFQGGPVTTPPKSLVLELNQPDPDILSNSASIVVSGKTSPSREILIFTEDNDSVIKSKPDGTFSTVLNLTEGVNKITVAVFDTNGESKSADRTVYFTKEKI